MSKGSDGPSAGSFEHPRKVGWLHKHGGSGMSSHWKKRWFIVDHHYLFYYKGPSDKKPVGILCLPEYQTCHKSDNKEATKFKRPNAFILDKGDSEEESTDSGPLKNYILSCESEEEMQSWIAAITEEIKPMIGGEAMPYSKPAGKTGGKTGGKKDQVKVDQKAFDEVAAIVSEGPKLTHLTASRPKMKGRRPPKRYNMFHEDEDDSTESPPGTPISHQSKPLPSSPGSPPSTSPSTAKRGSRPSAPMLPSKAPMTPPTKPKANADQTEVVAELPAVSPRPVLTKPQPPRKVKERPPDIAASPLPDNGSDSSKDMTTPTAKQPPVPQKKPRTSMSAGVGAGGNPPLKAEPVPPESPAETKPRPTPPSKPKPRTKPRPSVPSETPEAPVPTQPDSPAEPPMPTKKPAPTPAHRPTPIPRKRGSTGSRPESLSEDKAGGNTEAEMVAEMSAAETSLLQDTEEEKEDGKKEVATSSPDHRSRSPSPSPKSSGTPDHTQELPESPDHTQKSSGTDTPDHTQKSSGTDTPDHTQKSSGTDAPDHTQKSSGTPDHTQKSSGTPDHTQKSSGTPDHTQKSPDHSQKKLPGSPDHAQRTSSSVNHTQEGKGEVKKEDLKSPVKESASLEVELVEDETAYEDMTILNGVEATNGETEMYELMDYGAKENSSEGDPSLDHRQKEKELADPLSHADYEKMDIGVSEKGGVEKGMDNDYEHPEGWESSRHSSMGFDPKGVTSDPRENGLYDVLPPPRPAYVNGERPQSTLSASTNPNERGSTDMRPPPSPEVRRQSRSRSSSGSISSGHSENMSLQARKGSKGRASLSGSSRSNSLTGGGGSMDSNLVNSSEVGGMKTDRRYSYEAKGGKSLDLSDTTYTLSGSLQQAKEILRLARAMKAEAEQMKEEAYRELELARRERHDASLLKKNAAEILKIAKRKLASK